MKVRERAEGQFRLARVFLSTGGICPVRDFSTMRGSTCSERTQCLRLPGGSDQIRESWPKLS
jgi:hypothetical protein